MGLARHRPLQSLEFSLTPSQRQRWTGRIACLSRSFSGRLLLDLIGVANELHLGMSKFDDGRKVPHAWLLDPRSGRLFTPAHPQR
jgi:hypothetical protein